VLLDGLDEPPLVDAAEERRLDPESAACHVCFSEKAGDAGRK
jgi:hypothetical protein